VSGPPIRSSLDPERTSHVASHSWEAQTSVPQKAQTEIGTFRMTLHLR
jgi:hypothetical protein